MSMSQSLLPENILKGVSAVTTTEYTYNTGRISTAPKLWS